jgi:hypothetical protein
VDIGAAEDIHCGGRDKWLASFASDNPIETLWFESAYFFSGLSGNQIQLANSKQEQFEQTSLHTFSLIRGITRMPSF